MVKLCPMYYKMYSQKNFDAHEHLCQCTCKRKHMPPKSHWQLWSALATPQLSPFRVGMNCGFHFPYFVLGTHGQHQKTCHK